MTVKGMKFSALAATAAVAATAVSVAAPAQAQIKIDGSSTVYPITERIAEGFQKANAGAKVTVGISGTGGGFKKFCAKDGTHISNASRKIKDNEKEACAAAGVSYIEIPVAIDALSVVVNKNNPLKGVTVEQLKAMWGPDAEGKVKNWNQVDASFPNAPLKLYGPGPDSGTFDYFTEKVNGKERASRKDYTPSEDDNVLVQGVSRDKNALGYFGYAYYEANKTKVRALEINGIYPSPETVKAKDASKRYPLARTIYIYVNKENAKSIPALRSFVEYYLTQAPTAVAAVKYVPLERSEYTASLGKFKSEVASR